MLNQSKGTILYGMMGCGKSSIGKLLAQHLDQKFVDTDQLIQQKYNQTHRKLVAKGNFGEKQAKAILEYSPLAPEVVATGGSTATYPQLVQHLAQFGIGIFIDVDLKILKTRLTKERIDTLHNPNKLEFDDLYLQRIPFYETAATHILRVKENESIDLTLNRIIALLN